MADKKGNAMLRVPQIGDYVRLVSADDFLRGEEGQVKESLPDGRWVVRLSDGTRVNRHASELLVTFWYSE